MKYINYHIIELKYTILYSLLSWITTSFLLYSQKEKLLSFYLLPLEQYSLIYNYKIQFIYTNLLEIFLTYLKLSLYSGGFISIPFICYINYLFIRPALYKKDSILIGKSLYFYFIIIYPILFIKIIPFITHNIIYYFSTFKKNEYLITEFLMLLKISDFISFFILLIIIINIFSIYPLLISIILNLIIQPCYITENNWKKKNWNLNKILSKKDLSIGQISFYINKIIIYKHYFYFISLVLFAIITPPDILSLIILIIPFILIIELTIFIWCFFIIRII